LNYSTNIDLLAIAKERMFYGLCFLLWILLVK